MSVWWVTCARRSRHFCRALKTMVIANTSIKRGSTIARHVKGLDELASLKSGKPPIHPQQIAKAISGLSTDDAVFTCDVGLPTVGAAGYLAMNGKRRLSGSFWHGSMS